MLNFHKLRALIALRSATDAYKSEVASEQVAQEILRKLNRGKFQTDGSRLQVLVKTNWDALNGRVLQLLAQEGLTATVERDHGWHDGPSYTYWVIQLPAEEPGDESRV